VECNRYAGGIAGYTAANSKIHNSRNTGAITANYSSNGDADAGGIVGNVYGSGGTGTVITDSYNTGAVTAASGSGGNAYAGGIAGKIYAYISISGSYNTGTVSAKTYAGGIAGHITYASGTVYKNYNTGDVSATYAAGIFGYMRSINGTGTFSISNNAAANSSVIGTTTGGATRKVNRVVGYSEVADLSYITGNIALDTMSSGSGSFENESAYLGTDKTELELKSQATYEALGWLFGNDADNPWTMPSPGTDYPRLYWE
jgi:hypothetical protein